LVAATLVAATLVALVALVALVSLHHRATPHRRLALTRTLTRS
jgi:hypothetical protein